jgi:hypothetical protein
VIFFSHQLNFSQNTRKHDAFNNLHALIGQKRWSHVIVTWKGFNELREQQLFSFGLLNNVGLLFCYQPKRP